MLAALVFFIFFISPLTLVKPLPVTERAQLAYKLYIGALHFDGTKRLYFSSALSSRKEPNFFIGCASLLSALGSVVGVSAFMSPGKD